MALGDLVVATWNIHKGVGTDGKRDMGRIAAVIAGIGADILALQEVDTRFGIRTGLLDLAMLREELGLVPVPVGEAGPAHGWHGNLILVRHARFGPVHKLALPGFEPRGALIADLEIAGRALRVVGAHLGLLPGSRAAQTRALTARFAALEDRPTLLMGDLNEWRGRGGAALGHLHRHFGAGGVVASFPSRAPRLPLDRIMAGNGAELFDLAAHDTPLSRKASDHLPVTARLRL